jgi:hypothetical protein
VVGDAATRGLILRQVTYVQSHNKSFGNLEILAEGERYCGVESAICRMRLNQVQLLLLKRLLS